MELLAPAGSPESLKAAVAGGADAVYLGGKDFGARHFASNFNDQQLAGAIRLAHDHGMRVYVTVNTLIKEAEMATALSFVEMLDSLGADAIIIQDRGLLPLVRERFSIPVHASTQMGIFSLSGALWAKEQGIKRVILARELGLEQVTSIAENAPIDVEVFVHGALCYCFSGQCLLSSFLGGRSGNRGMCAQPCRKRYSIGMQEGYLLSTADILAIDSIPQLMRAGVRALKIEGRMRSPLYVYLTSRIYSNAIRRAERGERPLITDRERELLEVVFDRGYSGGYLTEMEVTQRTFPGSRGRPVGMAVSEGGVLRLDRGRLYAGDGLTLYSERGKMGGFELRPKDLQKDQVLARPPFPLEDGPYQVYKTKDREFPDMERTIGEVAFQEAPALRRRVRMGEGQVRRGERESELSFYVSSLTVLRSVLPYADRVYYEGKQPGEAADTCQEAGSEFVQMLPRLSFPEPDDKGAVMVHNVDQYQRYGHLRCYGSYHMNVLNSWNVPRMYQWTLSPELEREEIAQLLSHTEQRVEVMVFGRPEIMLSRDPTLPEGTLVSEEGARYPMYRDGDGLLHILHHSDLLLLGKVPELRTMGVDSLGLDLRRRHPDLATLVAKAFREADIASLPTLKRKCGRSGLGHYRKGVF
jgi:putative protease